MLGRESTRTGHRSWGIGVTFVVALLTGTGCSASTGKGLFGGSVGGSSASRGTTGSGGSTPGIGATGAGANESTPPLITFDSGVSHSPGAGGAASVGAGGMTTVLPPPSPTPVIVNDCPGPLGAAALKTLQQGGSSGARLLYPYDNTVFPVGLLGPLFQWDSAAVDATYVHLKSSLFDYQGCFGPSTTGSVSVPDAVWQQAGVQSQGTSDALSVEITASSGGSVLGPMKATLLFAPGKLKGDLFYNTYTSPQANGNGAVMRLRLGASKPEVFLTDMGSPLLGPCWSCHSLSANGATLVAQHHQYPSGPYTSASFAITATTGLSPPPKVQIQGTTAEMGLGAVYPDGSKVLTTGSPGFASAAGIPIGPGNIVGMLGPADTKLLDTATGNQLTLNGWSVEYAQMPSFSPDGTKIAFNWYDKSQGHTLAVADFDTATNTVSNVRELLTHQSLYVGWPFFTPDNKDVIFVLGNSSDYVSGYPGKFGISLSDLWIADVATGKSRPLARANGYPKDGDATYLPRAGRDEHYVFFPTVSPIQAGGYFWLFFTSRRTYGNQITQAVDDAITKKIWVSAINIRSGADIIDDPSNPPFYLPGQEDAAGNIRAFAALEPCHKDGDTCESGVDCCNGRCYMGKCGVPPPPPPGNPPPPVCSNIDEHCDTAADCCDKRASCVAHYCAIIAPIR